MSFGKIRVMNEMYDMSIDIHRYGALILIGIITANLLHLMRANNIHRYAKQMRVMMPIVASFLALLLFTGSIMMAAKHLDFTIANIIMIVLNIVWIVLESKRYGLLKHHDLKLPDAFERYRTKAKKILLVELVGSAAITLWMLM
jgi:hypothetical protein